MAAGSVGKYLGTVGNTTKNLNYLKRLKVHYRDLPAAARCSYQLRVGSCETRRLYQGQKVSSSRILSRRRSQDSGRAVRDRGSVLCARSSIRSRVVEFQT